MIIGDISGAIEKLKNEIDISDVISEVTTVKDAGSDMKKALCCFHEEKTPSLAITPSKGLYYCFGCHATGDIVSFYKDYYKLSTVEAIDELAEVYDVDIAEYKRELTEEEKHEVKLKAINKQLAEQLTEHHEYVIDRGISEEVIDLMLIGYSRNLTDIQKKASGDHQILEDLALTDNRRNQWDNVIVYPQFDAEGNVTGFKNRPLGNSGIKFIGTPSTAKLYNDGNIYGFHIAKKNMGKDGRLIVVEGQHDVLKAYTHGIMNVVGTDSTALNKAKLDVMEEHGVREIVIAYDGDNAGREASLKIAQNVSEYDTSISIKIADIGDGVDPDEYLDEYGKIAFLQVLHEAVYSSQYIVDRIANSMALTSATNKIDFIKKCEQTILHSNNVEQAFIVDYIAEKINISSDVINDMIRDENAKNQNSVLYNIEAEKIVLNGMMTDKDFRLICIDTLSRDDFYLYKHTAIYNILYDMDNNGVDINHETIQTEINNRQMKQLLDGYINTIYQSQGSHYALLPDIVDKSMRRQLITQSQELQKKATDTKTSITFISEEHLTNIEKISGSGSIRTTDTPQESVKSFMDSLHERMANPDTITGIRLGESFKILEGLINGIQNKKLITIAANQSVGKTTITTNLINHIAITDKVPWLHFTLEMSKEEMVNKIIGIRAGVNTQKIEKGNLNTEEYKRVRDASLDYHAGGLYVIDDCNTLESIINKTRAMIRKYGIRGISIDYLQLMSIEKSFGKKKYEEEGEISGALKNDVAKKFDIPVIAISQMSRRALDRDIQKAEDGQGAYKIAQDSDIYAILQEKSQETIEKHGIEQGNQMLHLDKNRGGRADVLIDIYFDKEIQRMREVIK